MEISEESAKELDDLDARDEATNLRRVEAALFIAGRFLDMGELVTLTDVNPILLRKALGDLEEKYSGSGVEIVARDDRWKMDVHSDFMGMVNKLATGSSEFTSAEQETLAIIAYKKSMKQSVLVKIRGNKAYDHVKKFVDVGLLNKKRVGHTAELSLNDDFYDYFSLEKGKGIKGVEVENSGVD
tara:strand:+ start:2112 stop:2663 length:552 start_codon:yes stop_codon:yes gene_type:complete